jgi:cytochrome c-type biogenesis protein CcmH
MMRALFACIFAMFCVTSAALADYGPEKLADPKLEARATALQRNLRCLVCQGESLDESASPLADDLRRLIRARIAEGQSDRQIKQFLVSRYGNVILMKPPLEAGTYALWFGPLLVLILGGGLAGIVVFRASARARKPG